MTDDSPVAAAVVVAAAAPVAREHIGFPGTGRHRIDYVARIAMVPHGLEHRPSTADNYLWLWTKRVHRHVAATMDWPPFETLV